MNTVTTTIRITTETHHDIGQHITYATTRPTPRAWHTIELDRHTIGAYGHTSPDDERHAITAATIEHYCQGETVWHDDSTASAEPTPTTRAIIQLKTNENNDTTRRGQTIINQIRHEREARRTAMTNARSQRNRARSSKMTRKPTSMIDLLTNKEHSVFA